MHTEKLRGMDRDMEGEHAGESEVAEAVEKLWQCRAREYNTRRLQAKELHVERKRH